MTRTKTHEDISCSEVTSVPKNQEANNEEDRDNLSEINADDPNLKISTKAKKSKSGEKTDINEESAFAFEGFGFSDA